MNNKKILSQAKQLIANNKVDQALELLSEVFNKSEYNNEIIQHTNNFNDLKQKERLGTISISDANTFKSQIVAALLALVGDIEKGKKPSLKENEVEKPTQQVINIINSQNVNVGDVNTNGGDFKVGDTEIIMEIKNINEGDINAKDVHIGDIYSKSIDYKEILSRIEELEELVESANNQEKKLKYSRRLNKVIKQKNHFIKEVISLAKIFQTIRINKERLKKAKQFFDEGKLKEARALLELNVEQIGKNQKQLLNQKLDIAEKSKQNEKDLRHNADEYLVLAKLTSIDYNRKDRFAKTLEYFELSLEASRNEENLFYYAYFLQEHNRENEAVPLYEEALKISQKLAEKEPEIYLSNVAGISGNLANVYADINEADKAIKLYTKALDIWRSLASSNPQMYLMNLADSYNNTGVFFFKNYKFNEAKFYLIDALSFYRKLNNKTDDGEHKLACVLNGLGCVEKSMEYFDESLNIRRKLSNKRFLTYSSFLAETLINIYKKNKDEKLLNEALGIYRELIKTNPNRYNSSLAQSLMELATLQMTKDKLEKAKKSCKEALALYKELAAFNPLIYLTEVADSWSNLAIIHKAKTEFNQAEKAYMEALKIRKQFAKKNPQYNLSKLVHVQINMAMFYQESKIDKERSIQLIDEALKNLLPYSNIQYAQNCIKRALQVLKGWDINVITHLRELEKVIDLSNKTPINWYTNHIIVKKKQ